MEIPKWLFDYAEKIVQENNFDSSHDMKHFINVYIYAKNIVEEDYPKGSLIEGICREDSLKILYYSAFSHDLIDSKYVDTETSIQDLRKLFLSNGYNEKFLDIVIFLINNMSYSKQRTGIYKIPEIYQLIMNIVSDADKLDAYRVERVIEYQKNKNTNPEVSKRWVKTILVKRVLKYRECWLKTKYALRISEKMHDQVQSYVNDNLQNLEMYEY